LKPQRDADLLVELAAVYALRRDDANALEGLSRAFDAGYRDYGLLESDPIFAPLRGGERFRSVIDRMRRDVEAQRQRARERGARLLGAHPCNPTILSSAIALPRVAGPGRSR
jgi:hypothetical protein